MTERPDRIPLAPELAPSAVADDSASFARTVGMTGLTAVFLGTLVLILNGAKADLGRFAVANDVGFAAIVVGMAMMFFHASRDPDQLIRRLYGYVGGLGLPMSGLILSILPVIISASRGDPEDGSEKPIISLFFPFGWACFLAGLFFLIPFCRIETEELHRRRGLMGLGGLGAALALTGLVGGLIVASFAVTYGAVLALLGLAYLCAFVSQLGGADLDGHKPALAIGALGLAVAVAALLRSIFPGEKSFFMPSGVVLLTLGVGYLLVAVFMLSDLELVVLTRRELLSYFCSPVAYILLLLSAVLATLNYNLFVANLLVEMGGATTEPVVLAYYLRLPVWAFILVAMVPAITMRLLSEEKASGTYEVLMCAPVSETPVVLGKLLASLIFYMLTWAVWLVPLVALRVETGRVFDYRPLISFHLALAASGLAFLSMGLFFSCVTRNQLVAASQTFGGMSLWILTFIIARELPEVTTQYTILNHVSFLNLWFESLQGRLHLHDIVVQLSIGVFWTFLSVKVLEARRWM